MMSNYDILQLTMLFHSTDITMKQFSNLIIKTTDNCKLQLHDDHNIICCWKLVTLMHIYQPEMLFNIFLISHN